MEKKLSCIEIASLVFFFFDISLRSMEGDRGSGRPGEKGAGRGIPEVAGSGRKRGKLPNIAQYLAILKKNKEAGANKYRAGTGIKGYGK